MISTRRLRRLAVSTAALAMAGPALAHHGFGLFDMNTPKEYSGTLTSMELVNPHSYMHFDVARFGRQAVRDALRDARRDADQALGLVDRHVRAGHARRDRRASAPRRSAFVLPRVVHARRQVRRPQRPVHELQRVDTADRAPRRCRRASRTSRAIGPSSRTCSPCRRAAAAATSCRRACATRTRSRRDHDRADPRAQSAAPRGRSTPRKATRPRRRSGCGHRRTTRAFSASRRASSSTGRSTGRSTGSRRRPRRREGDRHRLRPVQLHAPHPHDGQAPDVDHAEQQRTFDRPLGREHARRRHVGFAPGVLQPPTRNSDKMHSSSASRSQAKHTRSSASTRSTIRCISRRRSKALTRCSCPTCRSSVSSARSLRPSSRRASAVLRRTSRCRRRSAGSGSRRESRAACRP